MFSLERRNIVTSRALSRATVPSAAADASTGFIAGVFILGIILAGFVIGAGR